MELSTDAGVRNIRNRIGTTLVLVAILVGCGGDSSAPTSPASGPAPTPAPTIRDFEVRYVGPFESYRGCAPDSFNRSLGLGVFWLSWLDPPGATRHEFQVELSGSNFLVASGFSPENSYEDLSAFRMFGGGDQEYCFDWVFAVHTALTASTVPRSERPKIQTRFRVRAEVQGVKTPWSTSDRFRVFP